MKTISAIKIRFSMMRFYFGLYLFFCHGLVFSQDEKVVLMDNKPVDQQRYEDIDGSPYLFENFVKGTIYLNNKLFVSDILLNYNGKTETIEYNRDGGVFELDQKYFVKVDIYSDQYHQKHKKYMRDTTEFVKGLSPTDDTKLYIKVFGGSKATVFKEFNVYVAKRKIENVGKTIHLQTFGTQFLYYLLKDGDLKVFKLKHKNVLEELGGGKELQNFVKANKLKLDNEGDLVKLLEYYNSMGS